MTGGSMCCVAICKNTSKKAKENNEKIKFFSFPKDPSISKEWVQRCYRKDSFSLQYKRICSRYFTIDDYSDALQAKVMNIQPKKLKKTAVPSLHLRNVEENLTPKVTKQPTRTTRGRKRKQAVRKSSNRHQSKTPTVTSPDMEIDSRVTQENGILSDISTSCNKSVEADLKLQIQKLQEENQILNIKIRAMEANEKVLKQKLIEAHKRNPLLIITSP